MRYKFWIFILICFSVFLIFFETNVRIKKTIFALTDNIKVSYHHMVSSLEDIHDEFFRQAKAIIFYKQKYQEYEKVLLELKDTQDKLNSVLKFYPQLNLFKSSVFSPAMVMSYVELSQYNRVWLHTTQEHLDNTIFGIVRDGNVLGIAMKQDDRLLGLFNGDEKCSYSVFIGPNKTPALVHFDPNDQEILLADFIPQYYEVKEGDEVVTSGLDGIFIENIPVGKITKVNDNSGYITATIAPYATKKAPKYLWIIDRKQNEKITK